MENHEHKRNRSIKLAVITSIISKFGTLVLRLVSIPIAIRLLGMDQFGVYAMITMAVGLIDTFHIGIGPALTKGIARAVAKDDSENEQNLFATGFLISTGLTLLLAGVFGFILATLPIPLLFGEKFTPHAEPMLRACWIGLGIIGIEMICIVCEKARDGYLETNINNAWGAFGNILGAISLLVGIWYFPTIEFLVLAINGSISIGKLGNTIHFFIQRKYLWPHFDRFRKSFIKILAFDGFRFSITYVLSALIEYNAIAYLIGRTAGPEAVSVYQVMITIHFSLTGMMHMLTTPIWPALMDAHARGHTQWIQKTARKLHLLCPAFALAVAIGLIALGPWIIPLWAGADFREAVGENFQMTRLTLVGFSAWFMIHIWRHVNQVLLLGIGKINLAFWTIIVESSLVLVLVSVTIYGGEDLAMIYGMAAAGIALVSGWIFPLMFYRATRNQIKESEPVLNKAAESVG